MHVSRSNGAAVTTTLLAWLASLVAGISVPTGKLTPITPARPTPRAVNPLAPAQPAPVVEYSQDSPEPPPLDPSYVPVNYDYFNTLAKHHVYYVPLRFRNYNAAPNSIGYPEPQKYDGQTLGKNIGYKPYKLTWAGQYKRHSQYNQNSQYNNQNNQYNNQNNQNTQYNNQNNQNNQYNNGNNNQNSQYNSQNSNQNNQYNNQNNQYNNGNNNQYKSANDNQNNQYSLQTNQQPQQYEPFSTQGSPVSTQRPAPPTPSQPHYKVDYTTGKGSYDVTGKGGSKSEYYGFAKDDWSKKSVYPKKVLDQRSRKYDSHKY